MANAEYVLQTLTDVEHHVKLLSAATRADEIAGAANRYLASWSTERIKNLQKIDGGWGTFDSRQRPEQIYDVAHIVRISNVLGNHCRALKDAGIEPTPELLELDLYFALARQAAEIFVAARPRARTATPRVRGYRHWTDNDAAAA